MQWLRRHGWWGLLAIAAGVVLRGLIDVAGGVTYQAEDLTGKTINEIRDHMSVRIHSQTDLKVQSSNLCPGANVEFSLSCR